MDGQTPASELERLMTLEEVALYLHLSRTTVYRLTWQKALRTLSVGSQVRIPAAAVAEYLRRSADERQPPRPSGTRRAPVRAKNRIRGRTPQRRQSLRGGWGSKRERVCAPCAASPVR
jgi:excisionase family DNA binding protein